MILIVIPNNSWERYPAPLLRYSFKEFWIILEGASSPQYFAIGIKKKQILISRAYFSNWQNNSFQGDTGSPLMLKYKENYFLLGIVATDGCFDIYYPRVFTKLASYMKWIVSNIQIWSGLYVGCNVHRNCTKEL